MLPYSQTKVWLLGPLFVLGSLVETLAGDTLAIGPVIAETNPDSLLKAIPKCPSPAWSVYSMISKTSALIIWEDVPAVPGEIEYQVRYRREKGRSSWRIQDVLQGEGMFVDQLKEDELYVFQIRKICYSADGKYKAESDWVDVKPNNYRDPSGSQCNQLGNIEVQGGGGHNISFSVAESYWDSISTDGCNIMFEIIWCNPGEACYTIYWVYDGNLNVDFAADLFRHYPGADAPGNYLSEVFSFIVCPPDAGLPFGQIYNAEEWSLLGLPSACPDTLLYSAPAIINHDCGEPFTIPTPENTSLQSAQVGDIFTIGGFPLLLTTVSGGNGTFSGTADIVLPWQGQTINIAFNSLEVDKMKQVKSGSISLQSDPLFDTNDAGTFNIGGQICIPPSPPGYWDNEGNHSVTGLPWDPYGFGQDGSYIKIPPYTGYEEGDPYDPDYDPNGFNSDGVHAVTGTLYNEAGCDRHGLDAQGHICDPTGSGPYYWLNESNLGPETAEGIAFANERNDTLSIMINSILLSMQDKLNDSIDLKRDDCDEIRDDMESLLLVLDYDRDFIFGVNDEYLVEGMHQNFVSKPQPFQVTMPRNENTVSLENKHVDLYKCDERLQIFINLLGLVDDFLVAPGSVTLKEALLEKIKRFTAQQVAQYQNVNEFMVWLEAEILEELDDKYVVEYGELIGFSNEELINPFLFNSPQINAEREHIVSLERTFLGESNFHPINLSIGSEYSAITQFKNGDLWINGTHRAIILEQISKNISSEEFLLDPPVMPLRISKEISGKIYTILIDRITLTTTGATLDAFMVIEDQRSGQKMVFQGLNIGFSPNGATNSELSLASEVSIRLNNTAMLIIHGTGETYVSWDCNGFTGMGIDASIEFCREFLTPLHPTTLEPLPESDTTRVQAHFTVDIPAWGEFIAQISVDKFAVTKAEHIRWVVTEATLDFSELSTPDLEFPEAYTSPHVVDGVASDSWKGFHLAQLSATFSNQFSNDGNQISIGVENMIIDDRGFSGEVYVQSNIVSLEDGNLSGWPFSIDSLKIVFVANHLMGGAISGYINVPIFESAQDPDPAITPKDCFYYKAEMKSGGGFCFLVSTANTSLKAPLFKAGQIILAPNSSISVNVTDTSFIAIAKLNGKLTINASISASIGLNLDTIAFCGFEVSNAAPYFSPGTWSLPGSININVGGFSSSIGQIQLVKTDQEGEAALSVKLKIGLAGEDLGICADARVQIIGKLMVVDDRQKWIYDRFNIDEVTIDADIKGNRVKGGLLFYKNDPVYNQGFRGIVSLNIKALQAEILAVAQFGKHSSDYKYFFVDALVNLENGIGAGSFKILGLGGGLYYHMSRDTSNSLPIPSFPTGLPELGNLGETLSNIIYVPNNTISIGFKATVVFATVEERAFNGNASFEIVFNSGGGIHSISIEGNARFMAEVDFGQLPTSQENASSPPIPATEVPLTAYVKISYDFNNKILDGNLNVFLNTPTFKGKGVNGQMVWAKLYFSPHKWFINIGTPSNPCGIIFEIPNVGQIGEVTAYLDIGTNIEPMPPLPPEVVAIAGAIRAHPMRGTGKGFAFGAAIRISTGEIKFLILRAELNIGAGFDVLIQDYGEATCFHSGKKPGINGWYASGQVYAYLEGKVGVKVFGKVRPIIELGVAAALQARLPNPVYMQGAFGVKYRLLGGLIKGNHKFRFEVGTQCELIHPDGDSTVLDLEIIEDILPPLASTEMPTDAEVVVLFNYPIGKPVEVVNGTTVENYEIKIIKEELICDGYSIPANYYFEDTENYVRICKPEIYLPEKDTIYFNITVEVRKNNLVVGTESDTIWFVTGGRPDVILGSNIDYTYPINGQYNFHPKENWTQDGFIKLHIGQPYLFVEDDRPELLLIHSSGDTKSLVYSYDALATALRFEMPSELFIPGNLYKIALVNTEVPDNSQFEEGGINLPGLLPAPSTPLYTEVPASDLALEGKHVLTEIVFRVSIYETFKAKIETLIANKTAIGGNKTVVIDPNVPEVFSYHDISSNESQPLVSIVTDISSFNWYRINVMNRLYKYWPGEPSNSEAYAAVQALNRSDPLLGIPPVESVKIKLPPYFDSRVTHNHFISGTIGTGEMPNIVDWFLIESRKDWADVQSQLRAYNLLNYDDSTGPPSTYRQAVDYLLENEFPEYQSYGYDYTWQYTLPNGKVTTGNIPMHINAPPID